MKCCKLELTGINNIVKCIRGLDELKLRTPRGRGYLGNVQKGTRGRGSKNQ